MFARALTGLGLWVLAAGVLSAAPERREPFKEGTWEGYASYDGGKFTHCALTTGPTNGWSMLLTMRDERAVRLAFGNDKLALKAGSTIEIKLSADQKPEAPHKFAVIGPKLMFVSAAPDAPWFKDVRQAKTVKLAIGPASQVFSVGSLDAAVTKLAACAKKNAVAAS